MILKLIIFILIAKNIAAQDLKCKYVIEKDASYSCKLTVLTETELSSAPIIGEHPAQNTDNDVKTVKSTKESFSTQFPSKICEKFKNLKEINFFLLFIQKLDENSLKTCKNIEILHLEGNQMVEITESAFINNGNLKKLFLELNKLKTLPATVFASQSKLETLKLTENEIEQLPIGVFDPLINLKVLELDINRIVELNDEIFKNLRKLEKLNLDGNKISTLKPKLFENLSKLRELSLSNLQIVELQPNIFKSLVSLEELRVSNNSLTTIHADSFGEHKKFTIFRFKDNRLTAIDEQLMETTAINLIIANGNPCVDTIKSVYDISASRTLIRDALKRCFDNYKGRR